jgi:hypothetical protein
MSSPISSQHSEYEKWYSDKEDKILGAAVFGMVRPTLVPFRG